MALSAATMLASTATASEARITAGARLPRTMHGARLSGSYTNGQIFPDLATARTIARTHAVLVISQGWQLGYRAPWDGTVADTYYDEMMAANPRLLILRYLNAAYGPRPDLPESWYLHDAAGHRLWNGSYGNYLMDPRSSAAWTGRTPYARSPSTSHGWIEYLVNVYRSDAARFPRVFKGVWLDDVGGAPHVVDNVTGAPAQPVKNSSGATFSLGEWYALTRSVVTRVTKLVGGPAFGNALMSGTCYYSGCGGPATRGFFRGSDPLDAGMAEGWLRNWWDDPARFPTPAAWRQSVQLLIDANRAGRGVQAVTALPTSATDAQIAQWRLFAYASFLLGNGGLSYFELAPYDRPSGSFEMLNPLYSLDIGSPVGRAASVSAYAAGASYVRRYTRGKVVVNPTRGSVTVPLRGTYVLPDGSSTSRLVLGPYSAQILRTGRTTR